MFKNATILSLILFNSYFISTYTTSTQSVDISHEQQLSQKLDEYMSALTALNRFSGSVVVAKGNTILLNKGYGFASHEFEVHNTSDTLFKICSITKMITAVAILQLQEQKLLHVTDCLQKYVPDFPRGDEITIHHLLSHTSGLFSGNLPLEMIVCPATLDQMISFYKNQPFEFTPGSNYQYNNAGYFLLSHIIEKVSGKKYEEYIQDNILKPLNMHHSIFREYDYAILKHCASGYCFDPMNRLVNGWHVYENFKGSGGLCCTAYDLYTFAHAFNTNVLINEASRKMMCIPYHDKENYGYGCQISQILGHNIIEHGGMLSSGFKSNLSIFVDSDIYIIILSNSWSAWINETRNALAAIMFDQPYDIPSTNIIKLNDALYDEYVGNYNHPAFESGYIITKNGDTLHTSDGIELAPVAMDQFIALNKQNNNIVYIFTRNENGHIIQLRIKGGGPYFEIRCNKV